MIVEIICGIVTLLSLAFAANCYWELWKWARQCQYARIAVAYKRKVLLQAPLVEWLLWCNQLDKDKDSNGRVIYRQGGTTVAIVKKLVPPGRIRSAIRAARSRRKMSPPPQAQQGVWSAEDQTPKESKIKIEANNGAN